MCMCDFGAPEETLHTNLTMLLHVCVYTNAKVYVQLMTKEKVLWAQDIGGSGRVPGGVALLPYNSKVIAITIGGGGRGAFPETFH